MSIVCCKHLCWAKVQCHSTMSESTALWHRNQKDQTTKEKRQTRSSGCKREIPFDPNPLRKKRGALPSKELDMLSYEPRKRNSREVGYKRHSPRKQKQPPSLQANQSAQGMEAGGLKFRAVVPVTDMQCRQGRSTCKVFFFFSLACRGFSSLASATQRNADHTHSQHALWAAPSEIAACRYGLVAQGGGPIGA